MVTQSQVPTGQQTGIVTFPNDAVSSAGDHHIRHSAHGIQTRPLLAGGPTVFINHSGSRFSVPLHALKNRQTGKFFCQFFGGFFAKILLLLLEAVLKRYPQIKTVGIGTVQ